MPCSSVAAAVSTARPARRSPGLGRWGRRGLERRVMLLTRVRYSVVVVVGRRARFLMSRCEATSGLGGASSALHGVWTSLLPPRRLRTSPSPPLSDLLHTPHPPAPAQPCIPAPFRRPRVDGAAHVQATTTTCLHAHQQWPCRHHSALLQDMCGSAILFSTEVPCPSLTLPSAADDRLRCPSAPRPTSCLSLPQRSTRHAGEMPSARPRADFPRLFSPAIGLRWRDRSRHTIRRHPPPSSSPV